MGFGDRRKCCCFGLREGCIALAVVGLIGMLGMGYNIYHIYTEGVTWVQVAAVVGTSISAIGYMFLLFGSVKRSVGAMKVAVGFSAFGVVNLLFWIAVYVTFAVMCFTGEGLEVARMNTQKPVDQMTPEQVEDFSLKMGIGMVAGAAFFVFPCLFLCLYCLSVVYSYYVFLKRGGYQPNGKV